MLKSDDENLVLASSTGVVDELNASFYQRFPYPWPAIKFSHFDDPDLEVLLRNQDLGDWEHRTFPRDARIWVAGCGTNQAIFTALKFPRAEVVGSDVSSESLSICARTARQLGIGNLELRQESINQVEYESRFDYVVCTGVIHHNYDPRETLRKIAAALKPAGVLELMVYNRFHWAMPATFQKAMRILGEGDSGMDIDRELHIARKVVASFPATNALSRYLDDYKDCPESMFADVLLQPVLHSYTVESLEEMAASCDLELLAPCPNLFDRGGSPWNLRFADPEVQSVYEALPDSRRWHVANLLLYDGPPNLWFYFQPKASGRRRKSEQEVCEGFLDASFTPNTAREKIYIQQSDGSYKAAPEGVRFKARPRGGEESKILERVAPGRRMRDIFREAGIPTSFQTVNSLRLRLTTSMFPLLLAEAAG